MTRMTYGYTIIIIVLMITGLIACEETLLEQDEDVPDSAENKVQELFHLEPQEYILYQKSIETIEAIKEEFDKGEKANLRQFGLERLVAKSEIITLRVKGGFYAKSEVKNVELSIRWNGSTSILTRDLEEGKTFIFSLNIIDFYESEEGKLVIVCSLEQIFRPVINTV